ncbi:MAG: GNAT family N-acetyltransferase [Armatimonadota bacterium]
MEIRPFRPEDAASVVELLGRELHADRIAPADFAERVLSDPLFRSEAAPVAVEGGVVGFMLGIAAGDRGFITLMAVDSRFQRRGVGSLLLARALDALGSSSVWVSPYPAGYFCPGIDETAYPEAIRFLEARGFSTYSRPLSMEASLLELPERSVEGVRPAEPGEVLPFVAREFPGDWERLVRESAPGALFAAVRNGECVGFCRHAGERFGPLGVAPSERGKGIGAALLFTCLSSMRAKGLTRAWLMWTDDAAARLYAKAGFRETRRYRIMTRAI